ncbi:MAG: hypothetical protein HC835_12375 [Oscillatoriales cyanobacterium RM2_1_1]|nr:hypothetical protein [Oscillatoriales cyanobacterium SM2_3_0]NJO46352.1 hypothetical protein [Oscillatoriales cyanobacterium RM2_1_1]
MDITETTRNLIAQVKQLQPKYSDPTSSLFIDFYCQYRQGCDYLFPLSVRQSVRLFDILNSFLTCIEMGKPTILMKLMWQDVVGPTLAEYQADEQIEEKLWSSFVEGDLNQTIDHWDLTRRPDGSVNLVLRELLTDLAQLEQTYLLKIAQTNP